jgi:hypothetical protein
MSEVRAAVGRYELVAAVTRHSVERLGLLTRAQTWSS